MTKETRIIEKITKDVLKLLGIDTNLSIEEAPSAAFDAASSAKNDGVVNVSLDTQESGIVIGYHGEILESLQTILSLCVSKKLGRFVRISLEVGDYKKNRTEYLANLALRTKDRVLEEGREIELSSLKSWERRIIHLYLQEDREVASESRGEGRDRVLVIKPRE